MKTQLRPGAELETLTRDELADELDSRRVGNDERWIRPEDSGSTDAGGEAEFVVYAVTVGFEFCLTRLLVEAEGFSAGVPFQGAAGRLEILRSGVIIDMLSLVAAAPAAIAGQLPALFEHSVTSGPKLRNGEELQVRLVNGPASAEITARAEGLLRRGK